MGLRKTLAEQVWRVLKCARPCCPKSGLARSMSDRPSRLILCINSSRAGCHAPQTLQTLVGQHVCRTIHQQLGLPLQTLLLCLTLVAL